MSEHQEIWVSQARWRENWVVVRKLRGGGQGNAGRVLRKLENRDGFLKAIKAKRDSGTASAIFERGQCVRHGHRKGHSAP